MYIFKFKLCISLFFVFFLNLAFADSYSYWLNGWRKNKGDVSANILMIESPSYLLGLDVANLSYAYFAPNKKPFEYGTYGVDFKEVEKLKKSDFELSISLNGDKYIAKNARAGRKLRDRPLQDVLLWESGKYMQHYELKDVEFYNKKGDILPLYADLKLCAKDDGFALSLNAKKGEDLSGDFARGVLNTARCILNNKIVFSKKELKSPEEFSLAFWVEVPDKFLQASNRKGVVLISGKHLSESGAWGVKVEDIYRFSAFANISERLESSTYTLKDGWNFFVLSYADNSLKFFANGNLVGKELGLKEPLVLNAKDIVFAGRSDGVGEVYSMKLDEFKVYDKALSEKEVKALYKDVAYANLDKNLIFKESFDDANFKDNKYFSLKNAKIEMRLAEYEVSKILKSDLSEDSCESLTLFAGKNSYKNAKIRCLSSNGAIPVVFDEPKQCFVAKVDKLKRDKDFANATNYEDFKLSVKGEGDTPFLLDMKSPASITGVCPILCYLDGSPTGISVQLSKNWHERKMGSYLMAYTKIPAGEYILRLVYGFYGDVPSASHANLSLVGYGGSGRWEQLAIGAWGETICFDADNSLVTNMITDIRMLMARKGKDGKMWAWTNAGWGGDWLCISTAKEPRLLPVGLKTSYLSQGPCLTEVIYEGYLGQDRAISMRAKVQTLRTNDYARTFQELEYKFNKEVNAKDFSLYSLRNLSKQIAVGDKSGLLRESDFAKGEPNPCFSFEKAKYPLWFSAMGRDEKDSKPNGYKALAIRDFEAKVSGKSYGEPVLVYDEKGKRIDMLLSEKKGGLFFRKGDRIKLDIELFTLHTCAEDYYGDNAEYIRHLEESPMSYKTAFREALGNDLQVAVKGAKLLRRYPVEVEATLGEVEIEIIGGVGFVPLKVSNLPEKDYKIYEILEGGALRDCSKNFNNNDFYQLNYDKVKKVFTYVFNLPLSNAKTKWLLRRQK